MNVRNEIHLRCDCSVEFYKQICAPQMSLKLFFSVIHEQEHICIVVLFGAEGFLTSKFRILIEFRNFQISQKWMHASNINLMNLMELCFC